MVIEPTTVVICPYCNNPMQVSETIWDDKHTKIIAQRYICLNRGTIFHKTLHAGDETQEKP